MQILMQKIVTISQLTRSYKSYHTNRCVRPSLNRATENPWLPRECHIPFLAKCVETDLRNQVK